MPKPSYLNFKTASYPWKTGIDYRKHPELYRVGKGEQGVLICEPYKAEIGAYWCFKTKEIAEESSSKIFALFIEYLGKDGFVGSDMAARKYVQIGYTRASRYANYKGGKKYDKEKSYEQLERGTGDPEKAEAAMIFYNKWKDAEADKKYAALKKTGKRVLERCQLAYKHNFFMYK